METEVKNEPRPAMATGVPKYELPKHLRTEATVTVIVPHEIAFNLDEYKGLIKLPAGIQELPESLVNHWYVVQQGVKPYVKPEGERDPEITAKHVAFLKTQGYEVSTLEGARRVLAGFDDAKRKSFFAASDWPPVEPEAGAEVDLSSMKKGEIAAYAVAKFGLALDDKMTKDAMITAVEERINAK